MSSPLKLILSLDGQVVREVDLSKDRTTLGRRPYNDVVIDNLAISGEHAVLQRIGESVFLEDLNSTNGTYVNRKPVKRQMLGPDDVIEMGRYRLQFARAASAAADNAPALPAFGTISDLSSAPSARTTMMGEVPPAAPNPERAPPEATMVGAALADLAAPSAAPLALDPDGLVACRLRVLSGQAAGKIMPLVKARTTLGKPGVQVAAIVRGTQGVGVQADNTLRELRSGEVLEIAGTRIEILIP